MEMSLHILACLLYKKQWMFERYTYYGLYCFQKYGGKLANYCALYNVAISDEVIYIYIYIYE